MIPPRAISKSTIFDKTFATLADHEAAMKTDGRPYTLEPMTYHTVDNPTPREGQTLVPDDFDPRLYALYDAAGKRVTNVRFV